MSRAIRLTGILLLTLLASQLTGCVVVGVRPDYHGNISGSYYWGNYGYRRGGYYGGHHHRPMGRPAYHGGRPRFGGHRGGGHRRR
jgi:hypothetical protein